MKNSPESSFERRGEILYVTARGIFESEWLMNLITTIATNVKENPAKGIFFDIRKLSGDWKVSDHFLAGSKAAYITVRIPIAVIGNEPLIDPERLGELVARNRGLNVRVFTDYKEAETWFEKSILTI